MYLANVAARKLVQGRRVSAKGPRELFTDVSVGAVEVVAIQPNQGQDSPDYVRVTVKWAAVPVRAQLPCRIPDKLPKRFFATDYVLARQAGARSVPEKDLLSLHCYNCGFPYAEKGNGDCEACGSALNNGHHDWILVESGAIRQAA